MGQCTSFFLSFGVFAHFSKFSMYAWEKKSKNVSFYKGVCMCKAKLTLVRFFLDFFFVHLSLNTSDGSNLYIGTLSFPQPGLKGPRNALWAFCPGGPGGGGPGGVLLFCCLMGCYCPFKSRLLPNKIWLQVIFNIGQYWVFIIEGRGGSTSQNKEKKHFTVTWTNYLFEI